MLNPYLLPTTTQVHAGTQIKEAIVGCTCKGECKGGRRSLNVNWCELVPLAVCVCAKDNLSSPPIVLLSFEKQLLLCMLNKC